MKMLLYCTKAKNKYDRLVRDEHYGKPFYLYGAITENFESLNGKIVAECDFEVEDLRIVDDDPLGAYWYETKTLSENEVLEKSCLTDDELYEYLGEDNEGYAIHIKNLHIFDEPKELSKYYTKKKNNVEKNEDLFMDGILYTPIKSAPQNMMYAQEIVPFKEEHLIRGVLQEFRGNRVNEYILISIQPQWLCKILNGEKTIEIRKKVLKEMLKNE